MSNVRLIDGGDADDAPSAPQLAARDSFEFMTFEDCGISFDELPKPMTWKVLLMPKQPRKISAGGIHLPDAAQEVESHLTYIGQVVAMGPMVGKSERFLNPESTAWHRLLRKNAPPKYLYELKLLDWVVYGRYAGGAKLFKGVRFLTVNDDEITDRIDGPNGFKVYT